MAAMPSSPGPSVLHVRRKSSQCEGDKKLESTSACGRKERFPARGSEDLLAEAGGVRWGGGGVFRMHSAETIGRGRKDARHCRAQHPATERRGGNMDAQTFSRAHITRLWRM